MNLTEYNHLSFDGKASLLNRYGQFLERRSSKVGGRIYTYALFGFYVEVGYRFDKRVQYLKASSDKGATVQGGDYLHLIHLN